MLLMLVPGAKKKYVLEELLGFVLQVEGLIWRQTNHLNSEIKL